MKNILLVAMLCIAYTTSAQTLGYNDIGVLFSKENINGTARYNAMSGAFGALGGDVSAMEINPAGAAIFMNSEFTTTLNFQKIKTAASYYGNTINSENNITDLSQTGGVFVFSSSRRNSNGSKIAFGFNYSIASDFENFWAAEGNNNYPTWINDENDENIQYLNSNGQYFENLTNGKNTKYSFTLASEVNSNFYVGASVNSFNIENFQKALLEEYNNDGNGNNLDASLIQELFTYGDGISFSLGFISKPADNIRFGLSYQSPVWYSLAEDYLDYDIEIYLSNTNELITDYSGYSAFDYKLKTADKFTGSFAYIFDSQGLISVDYSYKNYGNIKLSNGNFTNENQSFKNDLQGVGELRLGTEWRFDNISVRGGYHVEKSPYKNAINSDNVKGYSLGAGYKFRGGKLDFSYQNSSNTAPYNFYPQYGQIDAAELDYNNDNFAITLVLNI